MGLAEIGFRFRPQQLIPRIRYRVTRYPVQPYRERHSPPFESRKIGQGVLKDLCRQVFGLMPVAHTPDDEGVNTLEVVLVEGGKSTRVFLRGLNQHTLLLHHSYKLPVRQKVTAKNTELAANYANDANGAHQKL